MKEKLFISDSKKYVQIEELLEKEFSASKIGRIEIQETPLGTRVIIYTLTPGLIIGTAGDKIRDVTKKLDTLGIKNPQIDVQKIKNPDLDPNIIAKNISTAIERGLNHKKVGNFYLSKVMKAGAMGCEIIISGKLTGEKASKERFYSGFVEKSGTKENILKGFSIANPKQGTIGIKVFILLPPAKEAEETTKEVQEKVAVEEKKQVEEKKAGEELV